MRDFFKGTLRIRLGQMDMASFARFDCFAQDLAVATIATISRYLNFFEQATALVVGREIQVIGTNHKEQGGEVNQFLATLVALHFTPVSQSVRRS